MYYCTQNTLYNFVLRCGLLVFTLLLNEGECKESKAQDSSTPSAIKSSLDPHHHHHTHSKYDLWPILSQDKKSLLPWDQHAQQQMPNIVPLTVHEQMQRQKKASSIPPSSRAANNGKFKKSTKAHHEPYDENDEASVRTESKSEHKKQKGKTSDYAEEETGASPEELEAIREKALNFGKLVLNFLAKQVLAPAELSENGMERQGRGFFSSPFRHPQERQEGGGEGEGNRNRVIDWVARLIGVQGKTLGEFLREYQVHVLYDLVFTFFKWIFFLYAGLLIP